MFISDWVVFDTMMVTSIDDSLTHPLHPIWDIRLQQTFAIQTCPILWPDCFAPCKTHLFQLFHHCPLPGGFWPASFPSSRWGPSHGNFGYSVFQPKHQLIKSGNYDPSKSTWKVLKTVLSHLKGDQSWHGQGFFDP